MTSEVEICNVALAHVGLHAIQSLSEPVEEARQCARLYPVVRDRLLQMHPWNFATKRVVLAELAEDATPYAYAYAIPADCLMACIVQATDGRDYAPRIEFAVAGDRILTDQPAAELTYTLTPDPAAFDAMFVDALAWSLAADLAVPLKGDPALHGHLYEMAARAISAATTSDASSGWHKPTEFTPTLDARL